MRYEILALVDQRWQIVQVIDDGRDELGRPFDRLDYEKLERRVEAAASAVLSQTGVSAVRVVRERERADGFVTRAEVLSRQAPPVPADKKVAVLDVAGPVPVCRGLDDLFARPACRAIGTMLRPLLDKLGATPIELVTYEATSQAVLQQDSAINTAISRAARAQEGDTERQRSNFLGNLVDRARLRVKAAQAERNMPRLGPEGLDALLDALEGRVAPEDFRFWAFRSLSAHFKGVSLYGKLEIVLDLAKPNPSAVGMGLLDEFAACLIDAPSLLKDVLGDQNELGPALLLLAQIAAGRAPAGAAADAPSVRLAAELAAGRLPQAHQALWSRILRSIEGRKRLTRGGANEEWAGLMTLERALLEIVPQAWQGPVQAAVLRRQTALREEVMDQL
ncbi:hypothetical protein GCM10011611_46880 [Aliidongia dinghuensis]|uniref:Uncharacterized protein n=1 Tax=Aliidongia dinghuensis TaxID=1867774 RepID=A0A8J2YX64_9PROT|nr:hypothetical protein [Aliidongia dinghuensis]GGF35224.1 hypothetical protein GCM10011611_46880 [Aliidongia dinghuensis]